MKPLHRSKLALQLIAATMMVASASAQDKKGTNLSDSATVPTAAKPVDQLVLGYRLADYARTMRDARTMIVAARLVDSITLKDGTEAGKVEGPGTGTTTGTAAGTARPTTGADLFAEARQLANGDADLLAEVEKAQAEASRGIPGGAIRTVQYVPGQTTWTVRSAVRGGEPFTVGARRDSATPVDLKVYDENGNLVCQDVSHNVTMYCRFNPIWTGPFSFQMINHGDGGTGLAFVTS